MNASPRALPPRDPWPILKNSVSKSASAVSKSATIPFCRRFRRAAMVSARWRRWLSTSLKSSSLIGRTCAARVISVRAKSQREKSLRLQWRRKEASGMVSNCRSSALRVEARPISVPSGMRKTKSPKPSASLKKRRTSWYRESELLSTKAAGIDAAFTALADSELVSSRGMSKRLAWTWRRKSRPAVSSSTPLRGKRTSEITPST